LRHGRLDVHPNDEALGRPDRAPKGACSSDACQRCFVCVPISSHKRHSRRLIRFSQVSEVLVIDPDEKATAALVPALLEAGYGVRVSRTGAAGLNSARANRPDAVILEAVLSDISGTEICLSLKNDPTTRGVWVILVSSKNADVDRVLGLELGADDYVAKPFSVREIVLRVQALLRRRGPPEASRSAAETLFIDAAAHRVLVLGRDVRVTALELRLLCALRDSGPRVQSRQALLRSVWGDDLGITTRTVDTHIKRLRKKLGAAATCIRSVRGVGYGFELPSGTHGEGALAPRTAEVGHEALS
jgi:two-component system phosphate regulon response regulator PhoB